MTEQRPAPPKKSLEFSQSWFLWVMAAAVILMFSFVILPYVDPRPAKMSGQAATDFDLELMNGGAPGDRIRLSDLRGRTVILDFWASWCQPCREQSAVLAEIAPQLGDDIYLLGVATSDQRASAEAFLDAAKLPYPNAFDENDALALAYRVSTLPTLVIVAPDGHISSVKSQIFTVAELLALVGK